MARRCFVLMLAASLGLLTSCHKAQQFPSLTRKKVDNVEPKTEDADEHLHELSWLPPTPTYDVPLVFVAESNPDWKDLPFGWNMSPPLPAYLGLPPMQALAVVALSEQHRVIKIKVPRGLPDPTPGIPLTNPPTLGKWRLGKELFFTPFVKAGSKLYACNTCHDPRRGFVSDPNDPTGARYSTLSLVNVAYNRRQFWDGRVQTLEETLFQSADDEKPADDAQRLARGREHHVWAGFARVLGKEGRLHQQFIDVFGIAQPTQDAAARALATYLRTIQSGDSLYDRAEQIRRDKKAKTLTAEHFAELLKDNATAAALRETPGSDQPKREEMPALLEKGFELFNGKARCAQCHSGPLFTDDDFHNIGCDPKENWPDLGIQTGRAVRVPIGLKDVHLIGAFRTPTLRNLAGRTAFFHDGKKQSLREVVEFFGTVTPANPYVAKALKGVDNSQGVQLMPAEIDALVIFLRSLQGRPVEASVMTP